MHVEEIASLTAVAISLFKTYFLCIWALFFSKIVVFLLCLPFILTDTQRHSAGGGTFTIYNLSGSLPTKYQLNKAFFFSEGKSLSPPQKGLLIVVGIFGILSQT